MILSIPDKLSLDVDESVQYGSHMDELSTCEHLAGCTGGEVYDPPCWGEVMCPDCWEQHWPNCEVCRELMREDQ